MGVQGVFVVIKWDEALDQIPGFLDSLGLVENLAYEEGEEYQLFIAPLLVGRLP